MNPKKLFTKKKKAEVPEMVHTSSQIVARSSADLSLARSISIIESNGFGCNGVNPVANLEVLYKPSEDHFKKSHGIAFSRCFWMVGFTGKAVKLYEEDVLVKRSFTGETLVLMNLDDKRSIVQNYVRKPNYIREVNRLESGILSNR